MAYVRRRGNQLAIVHGEREPRSGSVQQRVLFTFYSRAEALEVLGRGTKGAAEAFRDLLQRQHPDLTFNWKKIRRAIEGQLDVLPDVYDYLNTGQWTRAAEAARRTAGLDAEYSFVAAFALFELGEHEEALESFLNGALNYPRAARMLAGEKVRRAPTVTLAEEADDHNTGVSLLRARHAFLRRQSRASRRFFRDLVRDPRVARLLDESVAVVRRWHEQHPTGEREAFDHMQRMRSRQFAQREADTMRDLLWATRSGARVAIH